MVDVILNSALLLLSAATLGCLYRVIVGPTVPDRVIALDAIGINLVGITVITSVILKTEAFLEVVLLIGIIAFLGTVAFAKFLEKGVVIERDRNS